MSSQFIDKLHSSMHIASLYTITGTFQFIVRSYPFMPCKCMHPTMVAVQNNCMKSDVITISVLQSVAPPSVLNDSALRMSVDVTYSVLFPPSVLNDPAFRMSVDVTYSVLFPLLYLMTLPLGCLLM